MSEKDYREAYFIFKEAFELCQSAYVKLEKEKNAEIAELKSLIKVAADHLSSLGQRNRAKHLWESVND